MMDLECVCPQTRLKVSVQKLFDCQLHLSLSPLRTGNIVLQPIRDQDRMKCRMTRKVQVMRNNSHLFFYYMIKMSLTLLMCSTVDPVQSFKSFF